MINLTLQTISSSVISEILADSFLDGVVLDTEHGVFTNSEILSSVQVIKLLNKKCFVRVTNLNKSLVRMCLDLGVDGIIFSTVETIDQSKEILKFCKYPKYGGSRGHALTRENKWGSKSIGDQNPLIIAQIETKKSVKNLKKLLEIDFDYYIIGPYDLSASLGCTAEWNNEKYVSYYDKIVNTISNDKLGLFLPKFIDIDNYFSKKQNSRPEIIIWGMDAMFLTEKINAIQSRIIYEE